MAVLYKPSYSGISQAMILLAVAKRSFDGLLSSWVESFPLVAVPCLFAFIKIFLPYVCRDRFLVFP